jgi:imidazolonepropionase-like amidohydrolase
MKARSETEKTMNCVRGKVVYTGKSVIADAYLVFSGPEIWGVAKTPQGRLLGEYAVLTPAFIDPHSHIGMARSGEPSKEAEANDQLDSLLTLPDALDSVQMDDAAFRDAVEMGFLYLLERRPL